MKYMITSIRAIQFTGRSGLAKSAVGVLVVLLLLPALSAAQNMDGAPYDPSNDADIDMYLGSWQESWPTHTHGSLVERDILTKGDPLDPPRKGAVLTYVNRFTYAFLAGMASTSPTTLRGEQEMLFISSGTGIIEWAGKTADLYESVAVLIPEGIEFTITNTAEKSLTMYLINEPVPAGFTPNSDILIKDEESLPIVSSDGHWSHIVKQVFNTGDGLATVENILTVSFDPMTIGHPHTHGKGVEEVWTAVKGTSAAFLGKEVRWQPPGTGYMIPPDGKTHHANINKSDERIKILYFARFKGEGKFN
jgi:mannose-6-phosphate isomerase-like protein (cupin superfamily)